MNKFRVATMLAMSMLLVAGSAFAQTSTSGAIVGTVAQAGTPLPGVTVELKSPAMQGTRTEVTDSKGQFRFTLLPPGTYNLSATLSGFNTVNQNNIQVWLGPVGSGSFLCYVNADPSGNIAATNCTISTGVPPGTYTVNATDGAITAAGNQEIVN